MGPGSSEGLQVGTRLQACSAQATSTTHHEQKGHSPHTDRDREVGHQRSDSSSGPLRRTISEPTVSRSQEGWLIKTGGELEGLKQVHHTQEVQDRRGSSLEGPLASRGLDGINRSKGCLLLCDHGSTRSEIAQVQLAGTDVRVSMPALWPQQRPSSVYKAAEARNSIAASEGPPSDIVPGRHVADGPVQSRIEDIREVSPTAPAVVGVQNQLGQICSLSHTEDSIPRVHGELSGDVHVATKGESGQNQSGLQGHAETAFHHSARVISDDWASDSNGSGHSTSPFVLSSASTAEERDIPDISLILNKGHSGTRSSAGSAVVEGSSQRVEWEGGTSSAPRYVHGNRCLPTGMGSTMRRFAIRRPVDQQGAIHAHKLPGALGGSVCGENVCQTEAEPPHSPTNGQHNCCGVYQQDGRHTFKHPIEHGVQPLAMVPSEGHHTVCRAPPRNPQHNSGCRIPNLSFLSRMAVASFSVQEDQHPTRPLPGGPLCYQAKSSASMLHQLASRPFLHEHRCLSREMDWLPGVCFPSFCSGGKVPPESEERGKLTIDSSPSMAITSSVPSPPRVLGQKPSANTYVQQHTPGSFRSPTPNGDPRAAPVSRMEGLRKNHRAAGISERSSKLILSGWSKGTTSSYQSGWKKWSCWCNRREIDPFSCDIKHFLDFLSELFEDGLQHRTINSIRSAVSMTHDRVEGVPIGQHPLVTRLLKGVYNLRPPQPRYSDTWNVDMVIQHLQSLGDNSKLTLKVLGQKLALLMALVEASRSSELHALDVRYRVFKPEGVLFSLQTLTKKRACGAPPRQLFFAAFPKDQNLCVVQCLKEYEKQTEAFRPRSREADNPLFLSHIWPHRPVTSQRIAHWVKDRLSEAGVDTSRFKAHSVRGAVTSAALNKGVTLGDILQVANWSSDSTFRRFYYRPTHDYSANFGRKVLQVTQLGEKMLHIGHICLHVPFYCMGFELYQCHMQRISRNIITNLARAQGARRQVGII